MRLDIKNNSVHQGAPVKEMFELVGIQLYHLCNHWPGARNVVAELIVQGFYISLVDDLPEAPGALGYHDIDEEGRPYSKVAVNPSLDHGSDWLIGPYSVVSVVGHEAIETVGNPLVNLWVDCDQTTETARELCDAVEDVNYHHYGADLTDFLYPSYFNPFGSAPFDYCGELSAPFTLSSGGYRILRTGGTVSQDFAHFLPDWRKTAHTRARLLGAA